LRRIGEARGAGIDQELRRLLPELTERQKQAEAARVQIQNMVSAEIKLNEEALAQQVQQKVVPALLQAQQRAVEALRTELQRQAHEAWQQRRHAMQGGT
jgi:hypothetical protein